MTEWVAIILLTGTMMAVPIVVLVVLLRAKPKTGVSGSADTARDAAGERALPGG